MIKIKPEVIQVLVMDLKPEVRDLYLWWFTRESKTVGDVIYDWM